MLDWDDVRFFLAVERAGTLAGAGRRLGVDPTTVGRRLDALEQSLRATLFTKNRDGLVLTAAGERVRDAAIGAEGAMASVVREAAGTDDVPKGRVRLSTIEILATHRIAPHLPTFFARYPEVRLDLLVSDEVLDIARGEADVALRVARPTEAALVARRLGTASQRPYAHRRWLEARGLQADDVRSLTGLDVLVLSAATERAWTEGRGEVRPVLRTNSLTTLTAAVRAAMGIGLLPDVTAASIADLVPLNGLGVVVERPLWLVLHKDLVEVARVRAVVEFIEGLFSQAPFQTR